MKHILVLGFDCATCRKTYARIGEVAASLDLAVSLEKVEDPRVLAEHRVMRPPGVVVDGRLVHAGGLPSRKLITGWLK